MHVSASCRWLFAEALSIDAEKLSATVADILKEKRIEAGLSRERVAELAGIHRSTVSRVEGKQIKGTLFVFQCVASVVGVSLSSVIAEAERRIRK